MAVCVRFGQHRFKNFEKVGVHKYACACHARKIRKDDEIKLGNWQKQRICTAIKHYLSLRKDMAKPNSGGELRQRIGKDNGRWYRDKDMTDTELLK